ncbi:MAG: response regulator transcription factor [Pirellulaceae bacterium]
MTDTTVYVLDSDRKSRESVASLVSTLGYRSKAFGSAEAFLAESELTGPCCIVTEVRLSGLSGIELIEQLILEETPPPTVVVTAFADTPLTVRAMRSGAVSVLDKPWREQDLWEAIRAALALDVANRQRKLRVDTVRKRIERLTEEERKVMDMMIAGKANKVIAVELNMGLRTVEARRHHVFRKIEVDSLAELVRMVLEATLSDENETTARLRLASHKPRDNWVPSPMLLAPLDVGLTPWQDVQGR